MSATEWTRKAVNANAIKNNAAYIMNGGAVTGSVTSAAFNSLHVGHGGGSILASGIDRLPAKQAGNFGKMVAGVYTIMRVSTTLAGLADTTLQTGAGNFGRRSINYNESNYTLHAVSSSWNYVTGAFLTSPPPVSNDDFGNDNAARPTRAIPGELQYQEGSNTPLQKDYAAKTGG